MSKTTTDCPHCGTFAGRCQYDNEYGVTLCGLTNREISQFVNTCGPDAANTPVLDSFAYEHLYEWCRHVARYDPGVLATHIIKYLATLDAEDKARALDSGWPSVREHALKCPTCGATMDTDDYTAFCYNKCETK